MQLLCCSTRFSCQRHSSPSSIRSHVTSLQGPRLLWLPLPCHLTTKFTLLRLYFQPSLWWHFRCWCSNSAKKSHLLRDKIDGKYRNRLFAFQRSVESNPFSRVIVVRKEGGGNERELPWGWEREACWEWKKVSYYVIIGIELISKPSATNLL